MGWLEIYLSIVEIERIIIVEVGFYAVEVQKNIIELLQEEKAGGHALSAWNGIAFGIGSSYKLEILLGDLQILSL